MDDLTARMEYELRAVRASRARVQEDSSGTVEGLRSHKRPGLAYAAETLNPPELAWRRDPVKWAEERAHMETWSKQRDIFQSVLTHSKTAVHSSHSTGKSWTAARVAGWWLDVHPPGEAFVLTTAPTDVQVKAILWREINKMHPEIGLRGRVN